MSPLSREPTSTRTSVNLVKSEPLLDDKPLFIIQKNVAFVGEQGGNGAAATYQHVTGAPVETHSPLGYHVGFWTAVGLNVTMLIGTGIFSTPANILSRTGSVGLSLFYWVIGLLISLAGISVYLELASYFPSRSGGEVVYLEQAYPKPKYFFPIAFAFQTVVLSFSSSNAFVVAQYIFRITNRDGTDWELKGVAIAALTLVSLIVIANTRLSMTLVNVTAVIKVATLLFITFTGFAVLGGRFPTKVADPHANFRNAFEGTSSDGYNLSNALVSIIFSYGGSTNSFNLANEVKNPIQTIRRTANTAVLIVAVLYILVNIAYFAALPKAEIIKSTQVTATLYFQTLFGEKAAKGLTVLPVISALGNMLAVFIGHSRQVREIGRQGVLPFPNFFTSVRPFGTPAGAQIFTWFVSVLMVIIPPAGSAFQFIISLQNYPSSFFLALMAFGLFLIRRQRQHLDLPRPEYRSWTTVVLFYLAANVFLIVMPWVPPKAGLNESAFGFFYAASSLTGIGFIFLCYLYYILWVKILPRFGHYAIRSTVVENRGVLSNALIRVPTADLDEWDAKHDPSGRSIAESSDDRLFDDSDSNKV